MRREVLEEFGHNVGDVHYHSSQPWPSRQHHAGLLRRSAVGEHHHRPWGTKDARWFSREDLRDHKQQGFELPRVDSIARRLIEDWLVAR